MVKAVRTFRVSPLLPDELRPLVELAGNLRWAWDPPTRELFEWADKATWEAVEGNPVGLLGRLSRDRMAELVADQAFMGRLAEVRADLERYVTGPRWAQAQTPEPPAVAYFSAEFGITEVMQTYSGGLGVLAGDHLKAASDLGLPLVGIGLLYRHGYFRQRLDADGWQREQYPHLNPHDLPLTRLEKDGERLLVSVEVDQRTVQAQIWRADVGRVPLLLLDTDLSANHPDDRVITDRLYGGDSEHRLRQEVVLGIGGVRALYAAIESGLLDADPVMFHANEGHAGFLQFERIRRLMQDGGLDFEQAIETARASVLFTTHTPVPAGIDRFNRDLMTRYFSGYASAVGVSIEDVLALGREAGDEHGSVFNMAVMGLRLSAGANGVSKLHGQVSRGMFADLWPGVEPDEVPITSITNGVHASTWIGPEFAAVYDRVLPPDWSHNPEAWTHVSSVTDDQLWRARSRSRERLVHAIRGWAREQGQRRGAADSTLAWTDSIFDPDALTIGFARRFATYKRATLLLSQPERLRALLLSSDRPVQIVFSGKAHPADDGGKGLIQDIVHASGDPELRRRLIFIEDYDMGIARTMVAGADVWLNNPRRPHEASGTSGEKAVLNGGLHASVLDGWWDEMYEPAQNGTSNGFAIGGKEHNPDPGLQDAADAAALFDVLERTIVPLFYDRADGPLPRRWLAHVRASLSTLGPKVLATRMVQDYTTELYSPLAQRAGRLTAEGGRRALELAGWRHRLATDWEGVAVDHVELDTAVGTLGDKRDVVVDVRLGNVSPDDVDVQILHGRIRADGSIVAAEVATLSPAGIADGHARYRGSMSLDVSGEYGLAARVVPRHEDLRSWADTGLVTWAG